MTERIISLLKIEGANFSDLWKSINRIRSKTLKWVNWYNTKRIHSAIAYKTPRESEKAFHENMKTHDKVA